MDLHVLCWSPLPGPTAVLLLLLQTLPGRLFLQLRPSVHEQEPLLPLRHQERRQPEESHAHVQHRGAGALSLLSFLLLTYPAIMQTLILQAFNQLQQSCACRSTMLVVTYLKLGQTENINLLSSKKKESPVITESRTKCYCAQNESTARWKDKFQPQVHYILVSQDL